MNLLYFGDKRLNDYCFRELEQSEIDLNFRKNIEKMKKKMKQKFGVGLSAPQIGDFRRYFIFKNKVALNPEILEQNDYIEVLDEGCLSIPNINVPIPRNTEIKVKYRDLNWNEVIETLKGFEARIFLHELDHLNGITILNRTTKEELERVSPSLEKIRGLYKGGQ